MKYYRDMSEYRHGIHPSFWGASGPPAVRPEELYVWIGSSAEDPEPTFGAPEKNIGWLDSHHDYPRGSSGEEFSAILAKMCNETRYHLWRAPLDCSLCKRQIPGLLMAEIRVRGVDVVYAAPNVVAHHVTVHDYLPPREFVEAVLESKGLQAKPVLVTVRAVPPGVLVRENVEAAALQGRVVDLLLGNKWLTLQKAEQIYDVSIVFDGDAFVVEATFAPLDSAEVVRRTWRIPEDAVLNLDQGAYGIESMLCQHLQKRYDELFRKGKPSFHKE